MSCYLNFYLKVKDKDEYKHFYSVSRNNVIYQNITDYINIPYYESGEVKDNLVKLDDLSYAINDLNSTIKNIENRTALYEKYAHSNPDYIEDILSNREYIEELKWSIHIIDLLQTMSNDEYTDFDGIYCNQG